MPPAFLSLICLFQMSYCMISETQERHTHTHYRSALHMTPLCPNEMLPCGLRLFLTAGSKPVSSSPALCAFFNQVRLAVLLDVIKNYLRNALSLQSRKKKEKKNGNISWPNIEEPGECLSAALWTAQKFLWCVINTDVCGQEVDRKFRTCVGGTGSDIQFVSRYFTGVQLSCLNRNPLKCSAALKQRHQH